MYQEYSFDNMNFIVNGVITVEGFADGQSIRSSTVNDRYNLQETNDVNTVPIKNTSRKQSLEIDLHFRSPSNTDLDLLYKSLDINFQPIQAVIQDSRGADTFTFINGIITKLPDMNRSKAGDDVQTWIFQFERMESIFGPGVSNFFLNI